jgi:hypothetical protein
LAAQAHIPMIFDRIVNREGLDGGCGSLGANQSPCLNSLITREITGNFNDSDRLDAELWLKKPCLLSGFCRNSLLDGTGNLETRTGNYCA